MFPQFCENTQNSVDWLSIWRDEHADYVQRRKKFDVNRYTSPHSVEVCEPQTLGRINHNKNGSQGNIITPVRRQRSRYVLLITQLKVMSMSMSTSCVMLLSTMTLLRVSAFDWSRKIPVVQYQRIYSLTPHR